MPFGMCFPDGSLEFGSGWSILRETWLLGSQSHAWLLNLTLHVLWIPAGKYLIVHWTPVVRWPGSDGCSYSARNVRFILIWSRVLKFILSFCLSVGMCRVSGSWSGRWRQSSTVHSLQESPSHASSGRHPQCCCGIEAQETIEWPFLELSMLLFHLKVIERDSTKKQIWAQEK